MAIRIKVIGSNGIKTNQEYTARDADHANRIERRIKAKDGLGSSITFERKNV